MARLLILKTGCTLPGIAARFGDFDDWFADHLRGPGLELEVREVWRDQPLPALGAHDGIVVTGSPRMVTAREPWSEHAAAWLADVVAAGRSPVLGVCYGHQLLAHGLGGTVGPQQKGREIGTHTVSLSEEAAGDPLLHSLPLAFPAHLTHCESVVGLPPGATCLGRSALEPIQVCRFGRRAWGVQFHPEFSADIMHAYLDELTPALEKEGWSLGDLRASVRETANAASLLSRFSELVRG